MNYSRIGSGRSGSYDSARSINRKIRAMVVGSVVGGVGVMSLGATVIRGTEAQETEANAFEK